MNLQAVSGITMASNTSSIGISSATTYTQTVGTNAIRTVGGTLTDTVTGKGLITMAHTESEVTARAITLTQHTHTDPAGVSGAETSTPN